MDYSWPLLVEVFSYHWRCLLRSVIYNSDTLDNFLCLLWWLVKITKCACFCDNYFCQWFLTDITYQTSEIKYPILTAWKIAKCAAAGSSKLCLQFSLVIIKMSRNKYLACWKLKKRCPLGGGFSLTCQPSPHTSAPGDRVGRWLTPPSKEVSVSQWHTIIN